MSYGGLPVLRPTMQAMVTIVKFYLFLALMLQICLLRADSFSIRIDNQKDYEILNEFLKMGVLEEEYGYVLEGAKPISIRNFYALDHFPITKDLRHAENEFFKTLLAQKTIPVWNKLCSHQKNFVLKAVPLKTLESVYTSNLKNREFDKEAPQIFCSDRVTIAKREGTSENKKFEERLTQSKTDFLSCLYVTSDWEIQFINISKLKEVIDKNIDLFRYVLGPAVGSWQIVNKIAYSDERLSDILHDDLVLIGIVLGFGSHNSLMGGRVETILSLSISRDCVPFSSKSYLMQNKGTHSLRFLTPERYGTYYLRFAGGGDDSCFRRNPSLFKPSLGFSNIEEELLLLDTKHEPLPLPLQEKPQFAFSAFNGGPPNQLLFDSLQKVQKKVQTLLKKSDFLEKVLEKIGGEKPLITCDKPHPSQLLFCLGNTETWTDILWSAASRFEDKEGQLAFINTFCNPSPPSRVTPTMISASKATLKGLKQALHNLTTANTQFEALSKDTSLQVIIPKQLYFKITSPSTRKEVKEVYTNNLKNLEFNKEAPQVFCSEGVTIAGGQGASENKKFEAQPTQSKTDSSSCLCIDRVRLGYIVEDLEGNILFANHDTWLSLSQTIPGFAHGIQGMRLGEKRSLLIHPALAYGALTTLPPCTALIIKVHLLDIDEKSPRILPPLIPIDLSWIQDPLLYRSIEESIQQQPYFVGSFYRDLLDKIEQVDKTALIAELNERIARSW